MSYLTDTWTSGRITMMKINWKALCENAPADKWGLTIPQTLATVHRNYCIPMTQRGLCTTVCANCKLNLVNAFKLEEARIPIALLTYNLKSEFAKNQDAVVHEAPKKPLDWGLPALEERPFDALRKEFESRASPS